MEKKKLDRLDPNVSLLFSYVFTIASNVGTPWIPKLQVSHLGCPAEVSWPSFEAMRDEFPRELSAMVKLCRNVVKKFRATSSYSESILANRRLQQVGGLLVAHQNEGTQQA